MDTGGMYLGKRFLAGTKKRIESAVLPALESIYGHGEPAPRGDFRPTLKPIERVVSFYDYSACGISVAAHLAATGHVRAGRLVKILLNTMEFYAREIHGHEVPHHGVWNVPLRRTLLHLALAYRALGSSASSRTMQRLRGLMAGQVPLAIEHCRGFLPGREDLHLAGVNNHTAIFMQGIWYCGQVLKRGDWVELAREFAERYYASGHPDGYFEEHTNAEREGGPSMMYTPLTAGCLFDVLDGRNHPREKFVRAGNVYRMFLNERRESIPLADERANGTSSSRSYGLALHSLTPRGRAFIRETLEDADFGTMTPEALAVIHHEIDLMRTGPTKAPEYRTDGARRITLPLGIVRAHGFTAGISALRALNRVLAPGSDYALDRQNMLYLSHRDVGVILTGIKSKRDPEFSTFRAGEDAYTLRTGTLKMGAEWAEATLHYETFTGTLRWDIGKTARLTLRADTDEAIVTTLPATEAASVRCAVPVERVRLRGFSPYSAGNEAPEVPALRLRWRKEVALEFLV